MTVTAMTAAAAVGAGSSSGEGQALKDLADAEQCIVANLRSASQLLEGIHGRLTEGSAGPDAESLTKSYIEGVEVRD